MLIRLHIQIRHFIKRFSTKIIDAKQSFLSDDMSNLISVNDENAITIAVKLLKKGEIIALPTDTIYGLAADTQNSKALKKLYEIKGRNFKKPIAICINKVEDISLWGLTDHLDSDILYELLPGPVTILLKRTNGLNCNLNPGVGLVGIRIPDSEFVRNLTKEFGSAVALTSANISSEPSTLSPEEFKELWPSLGAVFDSGDIEGNNSRAGSTVINLSEKGKYRIIREGSALTNSLSILHFYNLKSF